MKRILKTRLVKFMKGQGHKKFLKVKSYANILQDKINLDVTGVWNELDWPRLPKVEVKVRSNVNLLQSDSNSIKTILDKREV